MINPAIDQSSLDHFSASENVAQKFQVRVRHAIMRLVAYPDGQPHSSRQLLWLWNRTTRQLSREQKSYKIILPNKKGLMWPCLERGIFCWQTIHVRHHALMSGSQKWVLELSSSSEYLTSIPPHLSFFRKYIAG
ncbi:hypothetical protein CLAIMM_09738 [Cladophialophora immunda]|nr:hypothetical protein CLAIMM_09738 [Cladophialophora immunda]